MQSLIVSVPTMDDGPCPMNNFSLDGDVYSVDDCAVEFGRVDDPATVDAEDARILERILAIGAKEMQKLSDEAKEEICDGYYTDIRITFRTGNNHTHEDVVVIIPGDNCGPEELRDIIRALRKLEYTY